MKRLLVILLATFIGILIGGQVDATTLYSTFGPGNTFDSSTGAQIGGAAARQQIGAPFTPAINSTLDSIDFAAAINIGTKNQITLELVNDSAGLPTGSVIQSFDFTNILTTDPAIYTVNSTLHPLLTASTKYWVVMTAEDLDNTVARWFLSDQNIKGDALSTIATSNLWVFNPFDQVTAFDVNGTPVSGVPEPGTMLLLGSGLIGLAGYGRKKFFKKSIR